MKRSDLYLKILTKALRFVSNNSPSILTGIAIGGVVATAVLAIKAGPKLKKHADISKKVKEEMLEEDATAEEMRKQNARNAVVYLRDLAPTIMMGSATILCIFAANAIHLKRETAIAAAATLAEESYRQLRASPYISEETHRNINEELLKSSFPNERDIIDGEGDLLCYEKHTGRYFWCTRDKVDVAELEANKRLAKRGECTLNYFFDWLGIDSVPAGNNTGWTTESWSNTIYEDERGGIDWINFREDSFLIRGIPVLMIDYAVDSTPTTL